MYDFYRRQKQWIATLWQKSIGAIITFIAKLGSEVDEGFTVRRNLAVIASDIENWQEIICGSKRLQPSFKNEPQIERM